MTVAIVAQTVLNNNGLFSYIADFTLHEYGGYVAGTHDIVPEWSQFFNRTFNVVAPNCFKHLTGLSSNSQSIFMKCAVCNCWSELLFT